MDDTARVSGRGLGKLAVLLILSAHSVAAQVPGASSAPIVRISEPVTVMVWNRPVVRIRASFDDVTPEDRAERIERNIENLPPQLLSGTVRAFRSRMGNLQGILISVDQMVLLGLVEQDRDPESPETLDQIADETVQRIEAILRARAEQQRLPLLAKGIGLSLAATVLFLLLAFWALRLKRFLLSKLEVDGQSAGIRARGVDVYPYISGLMRVLVQGALGGLILAAAYMWLAFVLLQFPYTEPWGRSLGGHLGTLATSFGLAVLHAIPGFFTVLVIFILTRMLAHAVGTLFERAERGQIRLSWLEADTARATRRIANVLIWLFAITVAYPFIPGSETDAFKGVSVFAGLMVSLGAAGFVNQIMSGLVIVYSRTFRLGDYVRVGDKEGVVSEIGTLSTKIATRAREEITLPNAVLVGTTVTNYTRLAGQGGSMASTAVTIGYDTPWRQVHALLEMAARRTKGVSQDSPSKVLQRALSDFYIEYQLLVPIERAEERILVLSDLHANIQDAFNEFGVQIMSPHFRSQPREAVVVAKPDWYQPPAGQEEDSSAATSG